METKKAVRRRLPLEDQLPHFFFVKLDCSLFASIYLKRLIMISNQVATFVMHIHVEVLNCIHTVEKEE